MKKKESLSIQILKMVRIPAILVAVLFGIHTFQYLMNDHWGAWGILPRRVSGLVGVLTGPFIHGDWGHLISNSIPLLVMGGTMYSFYQKSFYQSMIWIFILSGLGTWCIGRSSFHIGFSGVIYGMLTYVLFSGIFRKSKSSIVMSLIFLSIYTGYFSGVVPGEINVSWEGHLSGAIAGMLVAYLYKDSKEEHEYEKSSIENRIKEFFLPRDAFEKTKWERIEEERLRQQLEQSNDWEEDRTY